MSAYIFDTETTDRKPPNEIIEAAWIRIGDFRDLNGARPELIPPEFKSYTEWSGRFCPSKPSTFGALAVHHILPSELIGKPASSTFALPSDCEYLIGHSIDFDWESAGSPTHIKRICTHSMAQYVWPEASGYSQTALIYMIKGATKATRDLVQKAHGAEADVHMNLLLLREILTARPAIATWSGLWEFSEECRIPRTCPMKRYEGVLLEHLDGGFIDWCLNQYWLDPYFRIGLERVLKARYAARPGRQSEIFDEDDVEEQC